MNNSFKWPQIAAFRLTRHHLAEQNQANLTTVCQNVCGMQAQLMAAAEMQLWARRHDLTRADIHSALWKSRALVKTSLMRQTLHLIPAVDFSIYISALKRSRVEALRRIMSRFGIIPKEADAMTKSIVEALRAGPMTQPEIMEQIIPKVGKKLRKYIELAWSIQVFRLALVEGLICYGPEQDKKATFIRVDQWLPKRRAVDEREAKEILLRRYLRTYGPATLQDFSKWAGMPMPEARAVWQSLEKELVEVNIEDKKMWLLREDFRRLANSDLDGQILRFLPHFDPYLLGHADKNHLVDADYYKRVYRNQGWISPVVLLNGRVVGTWSYTRRGKQLSLEIEPFEKFSKTIHAGIEEEAASLGDFLETSWGIKFNKP
ncbi:winged helix DNA-binding domain-containing protein [candidate division KSB1 bacterium]|nr:winged helix DNA-binding domain-containing protein [candidate division KSB1 bacterium]